MTDRDTFAAAALTGLLASDQYDRLVTAADYAETAFELADAMLRERSRAGQNSSEGTGLAAKCTERDSANHDAAPAARVNAESVAPQPTAGDRAGNPPSHGGTGDTQEIASYARFVGEVMNWISEATGFLHDDVLRTDDARDIITDACSRCWDAFDRIAYPTIHGAAPEATAESDEDRTDKASTSHRRDGTGDTPATHATRGEGSEQRECTEPVAWGVVYPSGMFGVLAFYRRDAEERATASDRIVPLYRHPPCQDFSQKNLTLTDCERGAIERAVDSIASTMPYESQQGLADWKALRGLLRRLGGAKC